MRSSNPNARLQHVCPPCNALQRMPTCAVRLLAYTGAGIMGTYAHADTLQAHAQARATALCIELDSVPPYCPGRTGVCRPLKASCRLVYDRCEAGTIQQRAMCTRNRDHTASTLVTWPQHWSHFERGLRTSLLMRPSSTMSMPRTYWQMLCASEQTARDAKSIDQRDFFHVAHSPPRGWGSFPRGLVLINCRNVVVQVPLLASPQSQRSAANADSTASICAFLMHA